MRGALLFASTLCLLLLAASRSHLKPWLPSGEEKQQLDLILRIYGSGFAKIKTRTATKAEPAK